MSWTLSSGQNTLAENQRCICTNSLALLTMVSILALSKEQVSALKAPVIQHSFLSSQVNRADKKASIKLATQGKNYTKLDNSPKQLVFGNRRLQPMLRSVIPKALQSQDQHGWSLQTLGFYPRACNTLLQLSFTDLDCRKLVQTNQNQQLKIT